MASSARILEADRPGLSAIATARIPRYALAVMEALSFGKARNGRLQALTDEEWKQVLAFCDRAQLTLTLNHVCRDALPNWVRNRIDGNIRTYSERFHRLQSALLEIAGRLENRGIEFVVLKGISHSPHFTPEPLLRAQGDIDIWCRGESVGAAREALCDLGYRAVGGSQGRHLPPMVRETNWEWLGDYFASDLPIPIEVHYQLWDEQAESIRAPGEDLFWDRRGSLSLEGRTLPVLCMPDRLAFASLHLLMHVLHGDLRLQRAWEIAHFLQMHSHNGAFWSQWARCHDDSLQRLEAIVFQLVSAWFGSDLAPEAEEAIDRLPGDVKLWMERYALSPVEALFQPNKDEIWLQLSMVDSPRDKCAIFLRRVLPLRVPERIDEGTVRKEPPTPTQVKRHVLYLGSRTLHHARTLFPSLYSGARWYWIRGEFSGGLLRYLAASGLFCFGVSIFFLLYNLYLMKLGYREDFLGRVAGCLSLGTVLGAMPSAILTRRTGLRNAMRIAILGTAVAALTRTLGAQPAWLLATAFLNGLFLSLWAISFSPAVAGLTNERNRQSAFGIACSSGVCAGVLGGVMGGRLPGLLGGLLHLGGPLPADRAALMVASGIAAIAVWPLAGLRFQRAEESQSKIYPRSRFLIGFLISLSCFSLAAGAFNPFFTVFFAQRMRMSVERIGLVLSFSQISQALAMLSAPLVLRRLGQVRGITSMQLATGLALLCLAFSPTAGLAVVAYLGYMSFQYMSEPGLFSLLMSRVAPGERSGASALYFLVISLAGGVAAILGGGAVVRFGYPSVLIAAASLLAAAAFLFRVLVQEQARPITSATSS